MAAALLDAGSAAGAQQLVSHSLVAAIKLQVEGISHSLGLRQGGGQGRIKTGV